MTASGCQSNPFDRASLVRGIALALAIACLGAGSSLAQVARSDFNVTNGTINAQIVSGNTLFIGGSFTRVGPITGSGAPIDSVTGAAIPGFPQVTGQVNAVVPDGAGGWFIGGVFTSVGGQARANLAHVLADNSVSPWNPGADSQVLALVRDGAAIYAGGGFLNAGGAARSRIAAIDSATGLATAWNPGASDLVRALAVSGSTLYAGGRFVTIGGQSRNRIAAFDTGTGLVTAWNPGANLDVFALAVAPGLVYAGGTFTSIGSRSRTRLAALDSTSNIATVWNPSANAQVSALAVQGDSVYVGGLFTTLGGQSRSRLGAVSATTSAALGWNPSASATVSALALSGGTLYVGGDFITLAGQPRSRLAAFDTGSGALTAWDAGAFGTVLALATSGAGRIYAGGSFSGVGGLTRNNLASVNLTTGIATSWNPGTDGQVLSLAKRGGVVYVGGQFTTVAGQPRTNLAAVDAQTAVLQAWNPGVDNQVTALAVDGDWLYAGGLFSLVAGLPRANLARLDASSGALGAWAPNPDGQVFVIRPGNGVVYVGGTFTNAGLHTRNNVAALDTTGGAATAWNPDANGTVRGIVLSCGTVYLSGFFTSIGVAARSRVAAVDATSGALTSWDPNANGPVYDITFGDGMIYAAGVFNSIGGQIRNRLASLDPLTSLASSWNPNCNGTVRVLAAGSGQVFASGQFTTMGSLLTSNFAAVPGDLAVGCPGITVTPVLLPDGVAGQPYAQTMVAIGGTNPHCYAITDGRLPAGLSLDPSTGVVSGTPLAAASGVFTVTCTDARGCTGSQTSTLTIFGSTITARVTPDAHGLCINPAHAFVSVPLVYTRTDATPARSVSITFQIDTTRIHLRTPANPGASVNLGSWFDAFPSVLLQVLPNGGGSYTADATVLGLPCGQTTGGQVLTVDLASPGPDGKAAITVTRVQVRDCSNVPIPVAPGPTDSVKIQYAPLAIAPASLPTGSAGVLYHQAFTASSGTPPYTFALLGGALPAGVTLSAAGVLDGIPAATGTFVFTVGATDTLACAGSRAETLVVNCSAVAVSTPAIPNGQTGSAYAASLAATGGVAPLTWSVTSGSLPDGLSLVPATGTITGTPTTPGTQTFSIGFTDAIGCGASRPYALTVFASPVTASLAANGSGLCLSRAHARVSVPFVLARVDTPSVRRMLVTFQLDTARLALATPLSPDSSVHAGSWFTGFAAPAPIVTAHGSGLFTVDLTVPGGPCGPSAGGTALTVDLAAGAVDGAGAVTVLAVRLLGCAGDTLPVLSGSPGLVAVNRTGPSPLADLSATRVPTGNGTGGLTGITITWAGGSTVALYRAPWAGYPGYAAPAGPDSTLAPAAPWTLLSASATSPFVDHPGTRGYWYYVALLTDSCGNVSPPSNRTSGALDYVLGDVTNLVTPGAGDNQVGLEDVTLLGANYGIGAVLIASRGVGYLDVGPTTDHQLASRPVPDGALDFEDLMVFTGNFSVSASAPQAARRPASNRVAAGGPERFRLDAPSLVTAGDVITASLQLSAAGRMQGFSAHLAWDPAIVEPVSVHSSGFVEDQGALGLSPGPGRFDAALLGRPETGFEGEGEVARFQFRALRTGDAALRIGTLVARDRANRSLPAEALAQTDVAAAPRSTLMLAPAPNPFAAGVTLGFSLAEAADADLSIFDVNGRHVRTLAHGHHDAGVYHVSWEGRDDERGPVAPGIYYARFTAGARQFTARLVHLR